MEMNKIRQIVFDNEITLWWERVTLPKDGVFEIIVNGKVYGKTTKTHYELVDLLPETEYEIQISIVHCGGALIERLGAASARTTQTKKRLDITKAPYFAIGDGKTLNTAVLQRAFDDCKSNECVYFPQGVYLTGALDVHSDTEIYLEKGAVLQGTANVEDYEPKRWSRFEGIEMECYSSLLNLGRLNRNGGYNCKNVFIRGGGTISGGGKALALSTLDAERERLKDFLKNNAEYVKTCENENTIPGRARGRLINMSNCQNVIMSGITMQYGPAWNVHMIYSKDITTYGCKIISQGVWNGDGWDPDSSENCVVFNTEFYTHDDAIAIKSGKNPEGNVINRPTRNVYIFDCKGRNGIAIGSEMSGGIDGVYIWDCDFSVSYSGLHIKTTRKRGGYVRNIQVYDSAFVAYSVFTELSFNNDGESATTLPKIENLIVENLELTGLRTFAEGGAEYLDCIELYGLKEEDYRLENVQMKNVRILRREGSEEQVFKMKHVKNLTLENINLE